MKLVFGIVGISLSVSSLPARAEDGSRSFDCTFETPTGMRLVDGKFVEQPVGMRDVSAPLSYRFTLGSAKPGSQPLDVDVQSGQDFANIAGRHRAFAVANETYVFNVMRMGNCRFSDRICGAFVELTALDSEEPVAAINPISYIGRNDKTKFFHIFAAGRCAKAASIGSAK